jgi:hypothetical protein
VTETETLHDTVLAHLTDTVLVKTFVATADTQARVCTEVTNDCAAFRVAANQEIATLKAQKTVTIYAATWGQRAKYAVLGVALAEAACVGVVHRLCK